ncbi:hypothetical protein O181_077506 [Austropuccinia psidii MF-1]|uniref:Uncharacterized protein n=1 Tax=Austropuccinia psidii MF-1 TaxID=1389203 RepID=A0A9Q3IC59_9BASI|nr:hypothetical protein [Austropuccinia psidii MF-1]
MNVWKRERIVLNIKIPDIQNSTTALLGRNHAAVVGSKLPMSGGTCGARKIGLLEKSSQFLRVLLLMVLQVFCLQRDVARWTNVGGPIQVGGRPIYSSSEVPISRIKTEGIVKRIRQIANSLPDLDAEGSDEFDSEEVEVVPNSAGHPSNTSPSHPPAKRFQIQVIPSTPRTFQTTLATIPTSIPPASPHSSHTRPALNPEIRTSPIQKSRNSPIVTSQQLQPVASTSRRREEFSPLPFPAPQVFQRRDPWPIQVTREDPNTPAGN